MSLFSVALNKATKAVETGARLRQVKVRVCLLLSPCPCQSWQKAVHVWKLPCDMWIGAVCVLTLGTLVVLGTCGLLSGYVSEWPISQAAPRKAAPSRRFPSLHVMSRFSSGS